MGTKCERCHQESNMITMSWFNEEMICMECDAKERIHEKYEEAKRRELEEVKKGNLNFKGIGL